MQDGLTLIRQQSLLQRAWSYGWLLPCLGNDERQKIEIEIVNILRELLSLCVEETALDAIVPRASASLRHRLIRFASTASADAHALILARVLPAEPLLRNQSLTDFERRPWRSVGEKRRCYGRLLEAGLRPPGATVELLFDLLKEPDPTILQFRARCIPYLPDILATPMLNLLLENNDGELLRLVKQRVVPLSEALLLNIRSCASKVHQPFVRAALLAATINCLPYDEQAAAFDESLALVRSLPMADWRVPRELMFLSGLQSPVEREHMQIEAWDRAAKIGLHELGASNFAELTRSLTAGASSHAAKLLESVDVLVQIRCLPHLLGNSPQSQAADLTRKLTEATRSSGSYADLQPCIDAIPAELLVSLLEASSDLGPRKLTFGKLEVDRTDWISASAGLTQEVTWPLVFLATTDSSHTLGNHVAEAERLSARVSGMSPSELRIFFSNVLVDAGILDREKLCRLIQAIAIPLRRGFSSGELDILHREIEQSCALYG